MGKLGDYLREVREARKLTLQDVSKATAVRRHFLELLEQGRYSEMPSYVHVHGFLSQYSKFLGLDFQNAVKPLLDEECQKETFGKTKEEIELENETKISPKFSTAQVISAVVVIAVIVLVGYVLYTNGFSSKRAATRAGALAQPQQREYSTEPPAVVAATPIPEIPEVLPAVDNKTETAAQATVPPAAENTADNRPTVRLDNTAASESRPINTAAENSAAQAATGTFQTVVLSFSAECWYRFMADNDNTTSIDLIAPAGTSRSVRFKNFFRLDIGNAGGISMQHNGKNYTGFGAPSQPILNVYFRVDESGILQQSRMPPASN
jgi:cytoskeleton protein RodZ